ncbi:hypothetical protein D3C87_1489260 [compost metagenome]
MRPRGIGNGLEETLARIGTIEQQLDLERPQPSTTLAQHADTVTQIQRPVGSQVFEAYQIWMQPFVATAASTVGRTFFVDPHRVHPLLVCQQVFRQKRIQRMLP